MTNPLCEQIRNIARQAPMSAGTRTRLHAIAFEIEKSFVCPDCDSNDWICNSCSGTLGTDEPGAPT